MQTLGLHSYKIHLSDQPSIKREKIQFHTTTNHNVNLPSLSIHPTSQIISHDANLSVTIRRVKNNILLTSSSTAINFSTNLYYQNRKKPMKPVKLDVLCPRLLVERKKTIIILHAPKTHNDDITKCCLIFKTNYLQIKDPKEVGKRYKNQNCFNNCTKLKVR